MKTVTLEIDETKTSEHPLYRDCIQSAVALEQDGWSRKAMKEQAQRLRVIAHHYVGPAEFGKVAK